MNIQHLIENESAVKKLTPTMGFCIVSRRITHDEQHVGYMYREKPAEEEDSGWRFLSGDETEDYIENEENSKVYDVNLIANLDLVIVKYLKKPFGIEFERQGDEFVALSD